MAQPHTLTISRVQWAHMDGSMALVDALASVILDGILEAPTEIEQKRWHMYIYVYIYTHIHTCAVDTHRWLGRAYRRLLTLIDAY